MKAGSILLLGLMLAGCDREGTPAKAYQNWKDRVSVAIGLPLFGTPCATWVDDKYGGHYAEIPDDQCFKFDPPRRFRGLWRNDFEGSMFCPAPAKTCSDGLTSGRKTPEIWLDFSFSLPTEEKIIAPGGLYAIDFVGRRTAHRGSYGHMGLFDEEVIVDRMISLREVEPPAPSDEGGTGSNEEAVPDGARLLRR